MNKNKLPLAGLIAALFAAPPISSYAAPVANSPYYTDSINQYVDDLTSDVLSGVNGVLCHLQAVRPDAMVNKGAYVALVDDNVCSNNNGSGKGAKYIKGVVNSTQASSTAPMLADMWFDMGNGSTTKILAHGSVSQAPSAAAPMGVFRADFCDNSTATCGSIMKGYLDVSGTGLSHWMTRTDALGTIDNSVNLTMSSSTAGNGTLSQAVSANGTPLGTTTYTFAYDANYFLRNDGATSQCFDRTLANAATTSWDYGLYDSTTGVHYDRNTGFPIEYTDANGALQQGYVGFWGLWTESMTAPASGTTVNRIDFTTNPPTKTAYTLQQTGGKLMKFSKKLTTLAALDKVHFTYMPQMAIPATGTTIMTAFTQYDLYWDNTAKQFMVAGTIDMMSGNAKPYATPVAVANADMVAANSWGLWIVLPTGDQVVITGPDMANLATGLSTTPAAITSQNIVYPDQYAALGGLKCISDCPSAASIAAANVANSQTDPAGNTASNSVAINLTGGTTTSGSTTVTVTSTAGLIPGMSITGTGLPVGAMIASITNATTLVLSAAATATGTGLPLAASAAGLGTFGPTVPTAYLTSYTLNATTGNLTDGANQDVVNNVNNTSNLNMLGGMVQTGKMVAVTNSGNGDSLAELDTAKLAIPGNLAGQYSQGDVDLLTSYYQWTTSPNAWDQLSSLKDANGVAVKFDPPLMANFAVPNTAAYAPYSGSTMALQYGGFGQLWGVPWECTDTATNTPCNFAALGNGTIPATWTWTPAFSIPFDATIGAVTADAVAAGVAGATNGQTVTYLVKPLDTSIFLKNVPVSTCTTAGLTLPAANATASAASFQDPSVTMGAMPTPANTAPRVIQGNVKY